MIPTQNIVAWGAVVPWADPRQVEQDLIISRAIVAIFEDPFLRTALRFRGGTALNKLHFPAPLRYSEDIDLVRTTAGPIGPVLDALRAALQPWLGQAQYDPSTVAPKLRFRAEAEDGSGVPIRLKVETNISEIDSFDPPLDLPFAVDNPWSPGTYCRHVCWRKATTFIPKSKYGLWLPDRGSQPIPGSTTWLSRWTLRP